MGLDRCRPPHAKLLACLNRPFGEAEAGESDGGVGGGRVRIGICEFLELSGFSVFGFRFRFRLRFRFASGFRFGFGEEREVPVEEDLFVHVYSVSINQQFYS